MMSVELGFIILIGCVAVSRFMAAKATKKLTKEQKAEMVEKFTGFSGFVYIPLFILIAGYYVMMTYTNWNTTAVFWCYLGLMVLFILLSQIYSVRKLKEIDLGGQFMKTYTVSRIISLSGFAIFLLSVIPVGY